MYISFFDTQQCTIVTHYTEVVTERNLVVYSLLEPMYRQLAESAKAFLKDDVEVKYHTFSIDKSTSHSKRLIHVPNDELKGFMRQVNKLLLSGNFCFPASMYGYVQGKSIKQSVNVHKDSQAFLKVDIKDFFDSCTYDFIMKSMSEVYPFCMFMDYLALIVKACMLDDKLPQGAPTSPILSNIAMIPFIYSINKKLEKASDENKCFNLTIYADDITISIFSKHKHNLFRFWLKKALDIVRKTLEEKTPLKINTQKTRMCYMYRGKGVHLLGLTISHKHEVTIGNKRKQILKATIYSFLADAKNGKRWSENKTQSMYGWVSYLRYIEPNYVDSVIQKYNAKVGMDFHSTIRDILYS